MGGVHTALVVAAQPGMGRDEHALMIDLHGLPRAPICVYLSRHLLAVVSVFIWSNGLALPSS
jgi:hypothetical protein